MSRTRTDWIESGGGPLVIIPRSLRSEWEGIASNDYAEACGVEDFLGLVNRKWGDVLVLGDESLRTAVIFRFEGPAIVRWMYAPDERRLLDMAMSVDLGAYQPVETLNLRPLDEPYVIFDSADDGSSATGIEFTPLMGSRTIQTYLIKDSEKEVGLVLHRFSA